MELLVWYLTTIIEVDASIVNRYNFYVIPRFEYNAFIFVEKEDRNVVFNFGMLSAISFTVDVFLILNELLKSKRLHQEKEKEKYINIMGLVAQAEQRIMYSFLLNNRIDILPVFSSIFNQKLLNDRAYFILPVESFIALHEISHELLGHNIDNNRINKTSGYNYKVNHDREYSADEKAIEISKNKGATLHGAFLFLKTIAMFDRFLGRSSDSHPKSVDRMMCLIDKYGENMDDLVRFMYRYYIDAINDEPIAKKPEEAELYMKSDDLSDCYNVLNIAARYVFD
jgi:hypothetical protein